jgi:hypothetical protein
MRRWRRTGWFDCESKRLAILKQTCLNPAKQPSGLEEDKMLHLLYILAFTILAFLAVGNLIRNLMMLGADSRRPYAPNRFAPDVPGTPYGRRRAAYPVPHPELLDEYGNVVNEPYLVMRSMTVEDAREQLDALYEASPNQPDHDEAS